MKKFVKVFLALTLVAVFCLTLAACVKKDTAIQSDYKDFFKPVENAVQPMVKSGKIIELNADSISISNEFAIYNKDGKRCIVYDVENEKEIFAGSDSYDAVVRVGGEGSNCILILDNSSGQYQVAAFDKSGEKYFDFTTKYSSISGTKMIKDNIFVIDGDVYKGSTLIIESDFSSSGFDVQGNYIIHKGSKRWTFWDLSGNFVNSICYYNDIYSANIKLLSNNKVLITTTYTMPEYTNDYTYFNGDNKIKIVYEIVDITTGEKKVVNFNYTIDKFVSLNFLDSASLGKYTTTAQGYIQIEGYEIKDKLRGTVPVLLFVDENLNIKGRFENATTSTIMMSNSRVFVGHKDGATIVDADNKIIAAFSGTASYDSSAGLISANSSYYDTNGKRAINKSDYPGINSGFIGEYVLVTDKDGNSGSIDKGGNFTKFDYDTVVSNGKGLLSFDDYSTDTTIYKNYAGTELITISSIDWFEYSTWYTTSKLTYKTVLSASDNSYSILKFTV